MKRVSSITLFLAIISGFLFLAGFVIYEVIAVTFDITSMRGLCVLAGALIFLTGSFIAASVLGSFFYNWFTRAYYTITAVWMGFFSYLFLASIFLGVISILAGPRFDHVGEFFIIGTLLICGYGVIHARSIIVKNVTVTVANLPPKWRERKILWMSDLHLGQLHGPAFAERIVKRVAVLKPDIIFIGGDLFDGTGAPDLGELVAPFKNMKAPQGVFFITGNHEEFGDSTAFINAVKSVGIRTLVDEKTEVDGVEIIGVDYHNASDKKQFAHILSKLAIDKAKPSILLKHEPKDIDVARDAGISLQISGHTHRGQLWPFEYMAKLVYKGFSYGLKSLGTTQVYVSSGVGTWGPPMRVGTDGEIVVFTLK